MISIYTTVIVIYRFFIVIVEMLDLMKYITVFVIAIKYIKYN